MARSSMDDKYSNVYAAMNEVFAAPNASSMGQYQLLMKIYPALVEKLFYRNDVIMKWVLSGYNPTELLSYPVCGRCEGLAAFSGGAMKYGKMVPACTCRRCGTRTVGPPTLREWLMDELRRKFPKYTVEYIESQVDELAIEMINRATMDVMEAKKMVDAERNRMMGFILPPGVEVDHGQDIPTHSKISQKEAEELQERFKREGARNVE